MKSGTQVCLASAGTGKTFSLAGRFLALLFKGVSPADILATTFTRKAAGEILNRVLSWLAEAANTDKKLEELIIATGLDKSVVTPDRCLELLHSLSRELDSFNVRTIDSFFVESAKVFALDLGMPANWGIIEEDADQQMRIEAIVDLFSDENPKELQLILQELTPEESKRSVHEATLKFIKDGLDALRGSPSDAWCQIKPQEKELTDEELDLAAEKILGCSEVYGNNGPNKNFEKLKPRLSDFIQDRQWEEYLKNTAIQTGLYYRKELPSDWLDVLGPVTNHAKFVYTSAIARKNLALLDLLTKFEAKYQELKSKRGAYTFEDFPLALAQKNTLSDFASSEFRLSRKVDHLLLDEFQDTSVVQWQVLRPLIERVVNAQKDGKEIFCVGDAKQAIYRWREGEPRLLTGFASSFNLVSDTMKDSYRSSGVVLDAVNEVFANLASNAAFENKDTKAYEKFADSWVDDWPQHRAAKDIPGKVVLCQIQPENDAASIMRQAIKLAADTAEKYHRDNQDASIGILFRGNKHIAGMVRELQNRKLPASAEGGSALTDSRAVLAVLAAIHLADHPYDTAAAFHVAHSFLAEKYELHQAALTKAETEALSLKVRGELQQLGFGKYLDSVAKLNSVEALSTWDQQRLRQLVDLGHNFDQRASLRSSPFVRYVREAKVEVPNAAAIKAMTIHRSKGLEFDVVILPELTSKIPGGQHASLITQRKEPEKQFNAVTHALPQGLLWIDSTLEDIYWSRIEHNLHEQMCTLYVAMTRAKRALVMIVPSLFNPKSEKFTKPGRNLGSLLRNAFGAEPETHKTILWESSSDKAWHHGIKKIEQKKVEPLEKIVLQSSPTKRHLLRQAPSMLSEKTTTIDKIFGKDGSRARRHGTFVHALFENIDWYEEFQLDQDQAFATLKKIGASQEELQRAWRVFEKSLVVEDITKKLSKANFPVCNLMVHNEFPFRFVEEENGERVLRNGFIDRLVVQYDENNKACKAWVFDFKTDQLERFEDVQERTEHHRLQMECYCRAIARRFDIDVSYVSWELLFTGLADLQVA